MLKVCHFWPGLLVIAVGAFVLVSCEPRKKASNEPDSANNATAPAIKPATPKAPPAAADHQKRIQEFRQMQATVQALAGLKVPNSAPANDFKFVLPSDDWQIASHAGGNKKQSVWLFTEKKSGLKILVSCGGTLEDPELAKSAQMVYDSSRKNHPDVTKEWKVGNFTLRRSFIGVIDDHHGEATVTAFGPECTVEFNIASETMDRIELFKFVDSTTSDFILKNPEGGYPKK